MNPEITVVTTTASRAHLLGDEAKACYEELQVKAHDEAIDIFLAQAVGRHYEQLWVKGWYYNPAYFGTYFYVLSK